MTLEELNKYLGERPGERLEFNECRNGLDYSVFDTVCAFLNRKGGVIVLGIDSEGDIRGINATLVKKIKKEIIKASNDISILNPPFILYPEEFEVQNKRLITVRVPVSSQVHKYNSVIYDRFNDANFRVTQSQQIDEIYSRKRNYFTENEIFPYLTKKYFKQELFRKCRNLIRSHNPDHSWLSLDDDELLMTAGFFATDYKTGKEGYTLAAALLFGQDEVIHQILPQYRIDAMVRIMNTDRYDDRKIIQTNLIDAYEQLMEFVEKHLNDKFYMEGDVRISLREKIFREVIANLIVHREYTNAQAASFMIYQDRVEVKNANNPRDYRKLDVGSFEPFQKNPNIARFYRILGRAEEIGSGIRNITRHLNIYADKAKPSFHEDYIFTTTIPLYHENIKVMRERVIEGVNEGVNEAINEAVIEAINEAVNEAVIEAVIEPLSTDVKKNLIKIVVYLYANEGVKSDSIMNATGSSRATIVRHNQILKELDILEFRGAPKTGGYYITKSFRNKLE